MKLGAQLYSVRHCLQTETDVRKTFARIHDIGYDCVQLSGAGDISPEALRDISHETELPIVLTHVKWDRILHETDAVIAEHRLFGCDTVGLGAMPKEYRNSADGLDRFLTSLAEPVQKIRAAGLSFAYHNHDFEFKTPQNSSRCVMDELLDRCPDWQFTLDTYWVCYAGRSVYEYIEKVGAGRLRNIHFKDLSAGNDRAICACGDGVLDFESIRLCCLRTGTEYVLVEQDNAPDFPDAFAEMEKSFRYLRAHTGLGMTEK